MKTQIPAPVLRSPDHLIAAIPFLLGFRPRASVVIVWIDSGTIALTQRVDWPAAGAGASLDSWASSVIHAARHVQAHGAVLLGYPGDPEQAFSTALTLPLSALSRVWTDSDCEVLDAILVLDDCWHCAETDDGTLAWSARAFDLQISAEVSDDFMYSGWSFMASREEVCAEFADPSRPPEVSVLELEQQAQARTFAQSAELEQWRDEVICRISTSLTTGTMPGAERAEFTVGLRDIRVRDAVLWHLAGELDANTALIALRGLVRGLPEGHRAPAATVAGICAWLTGDGVRASAAIEIALADEPEYGLALLVSTALLNGLPPRTWQSTMEQLSYDACRNGLG
ncbi:MAG: DUF4192 domain-containing protein [Actinomycetota bacterium]|nr:DUF4192 domain-containing protein [Actinomycetota bacterium]